jgi:hypothetical protein
VNAVHPGGGNRFALGKRVKIKDQSLGSDSIRTERL